MGACSRRSRQGGGWGWIHAGHNAPQAGSAWTDSGTSREERALKHRAAKETRPTPMCPRLAEILRRHLDRFGTDSEGRLFWFPGLAQIDSGDYSEIWRKTRAAALTPAQVASPLAARPYDLRHACVSLWLNAGVPATQVAEWAGHSVHVLLKVYAKCIDGEEQVALQRIENALARYLPGHVDR